MSGGGRPLRDRTSPAPRGNNACERDGGRPSALTAVDREEGRGVGVDTLGSVGTERDAAILPRGSSWVSNGRPNRSGTLNAPSQASLESGRPSSRSTVGVGGADGVGATARVGGPGESLSPMRPGRLVERA